MEAALLDKLHVAIKSVANHLIKQGAKIRTDSLDLGYQIGINKRTLYPLLKVLI